MVKPNLRENIINFIIRMPKVAIESMRLCDTERVYDIMRGSGSEYLAVPSTLEKFREEFIDMSKNEGGRSRYEYVILCDGEQVGRIGLCVGHRNGEICYLIDERYRGRGIATEAVRLVEKVAFAELGLDRIEALMHPENVASERVAIKAGYENEGIKHWAVRGSDTAYRDVLLYVKTKEAA